MINKISPVLRGNLLNIVEKITNLHPSFPHCQMLQSLIQKANYLLKENSLPETEQLMALFNEINCKSIGSFDADTFLRVQKQVMGLINGIVGKEMVRPL